MWPSSLTLLLLCAVWCCGTGTSARSGDPDAKRLYDDLLSNYNKLVRPVVNNSDVLTVRIKLKLSQLIDLVITSVIMNAIY
jgi:nicotinic acetylcholine receptor